MTDKKKLEAIEEAFNYYQDRTSLTRLEEKELTDFVDELKAAINYTHSCTELKDKKIITLKDSFIAGYKKRALMSGLKYDEVSELNAITNFKCWKSFDLDL